MRPVLGDFLASAGEHIDAAAGFDGRLADDAARAVAGELDRLVAAMVRCADGFTVHDEANVRHVLDVQTRAAVEARVALRRSLSPCRGSPFGCYRLPRCWPRPAANPFRARLVHFGETAEAKLADSRAMARLGRDGHPRNAIWFCTEHVELARLHENMETGAALHAIDAAAGGKQRPGPGVNGSALSQE